jgi:hypothetical protein
MSQSAIDALIAAAQRGEPAEVRRLLQEIVPECHLIEAAVEPAARVTACANVSSQTA